MKSFSNSYLNHIDILKKSVIGFEFELYSKHSYYKTLELLNNTLKPIKTWGFKEYHSDFVPDQLNFKIEPDYSGGSDMAELVTGPFEYVNAKLILIKILKFLQEHAKCGTRSALHINLSFKDDNKETNKQIHQLNIVKFILNIDEEKIFRDFPNRRNNIYAKSIKKIIPYKDFDFSSATANLLLNGVHLPDTKYYGVNFSQLHKGRLEFRYIGGEDYPNKLNEILNLMDYFILLTWDSLEKELETGDEIKLRKYLDSNIKEYKYLTNAENFIAEYPQIKIQVDKQDIWEIVNSYFSRFADQLYEFIIASKDISECILNWDSHTSRLEIVGAEFSTINTLKNYDFIDCKIKDAFFLDCNFFNSNIEFSHLTNCRIKNTQVFDSKAEECNVDQFSALWNTYFTYGFFDGEMESGVFRNGQLGENARISSTTQVVNSSIGFFNPKYDTDKSKGIDSKKRN
jgi:uncharacterized protein YjbI with pentapeptide repeats